MYTYIRSLLTDFSKIYQVLLDLPELTTTLLKLTVTLPKLAATLLELTTTCQKSIKLAEFGRIYLLSVLLRHSYCN